MGTAGAQGAGENQGDTELNDRIPQALPHQVDYLPDMSLRDWFAGQALIGLASTREWDSQPDIAGLAYRLAGAMLAERAKQ